MTWQTVIGLEIHIQLNTHSKAFCSDSARFSDDPNTQTSIVSLAHPGTLPKLNRAHIESAVKLGIAMNSEINKASYFERKQYFYPDLPKGYQISQQASPICIGGRFTINTSQGDKTIRLHHIHMEEDAGKSVHDTDPKWSKVDLNRAGVPLLEMVTEPDFRNAEEVSVFITDLQRLVRYLGISDGNMDEGSMRCDINISVRPEGSDLLNERCEVKNVNSRRFARKAIEFEVNRQIQLHEAGRKVVRQTLQFVPEEGITVPIREKESAHDYRYFPDPDLPPVVLSHDYIDRIKSGLPTLPQEYFIELTKNKGVSISDALIMIEDAGVADYYLSLTKDRSDLNKAAANWLVQNIIPYLTEKNVSIKTLPIQSGDVIALLTSVKDNIITNQQAKELWNQALNDTGVNLFTLLNSKVAATPVVDYHAIVEDLFNSFPEEAREFKAGKKKLLGFFLGEAKKKYPEVNVKEVQKILG